VDLTPEQNAIVAAPMGAKVFAYGIAGSGKTTAGAARLRSLLSSGIGGDSILVLTPQRTLQDPYLQAARSSEVTAGTPVVPATIGGLARRLCDWFWPLVSHSGAFSDPRRAPTFLTLETAQYYMAHIVRPLLDEGHFDSVTMDRNRLYSQILDSLNKSAAVGFSYTEIGSRLDAAWDGQPGQRRIYADAQDCASRFRTFCLQHSLLDFSLQLEMFWNVLWPEPQVRELLRGTYRHLIYDNVEEDVPRGHDLVREWIQDFSSALLIFDEQAGFRRFLGADVDSAWALRGLCDSHQPFTHSFVMSSLISNLENDLGAQIGARISSRSRTEPSTRATDGKALQIIRGRFYPEMLDAVVDRVRSLLAGAEVPASEIVVLAPFLSDALRYAITSRLEAAGVRWTTHRPSRSLRDEPAARALLTLAAIAHPRWGLRPAKYDVTHAFMIALGMDLVRAQLLTEIVYRTKEFSLSPFEQIQVAQQERITFAHGAHYSRLREWLAQYRDGESVPLDHFVRRLFGEVLSQPGFGLHSSLDAARITGNLVESARKFRLAMIPSAEESAGAAFDLGQEFVAMLDEGVLAALYLQSWKADSDDAVLVAPAHSFLMMNRPVTCQFWLEPGADGWFQRLDQPLTHTQVLSREWPVGRKWTYADEDQANTESLERLVRGLLRRCRESVALCISAVGEAGFEQRGRLLTAFQGLLA
jgi:hypothetical protein